MIIPLLRACRETELLAQAPQLRADMLRLRANRNRHIPIAEHRHFPSTKNPRLLKCNLFTRITKILHMVQVYAGNHRTIVVEHINRIQPST